MQARKSSQDSTSSSDFFYYQGASGLSASEALMLDAMEDIHRKVIFLNRYVVQSLIPNLWKRNTGPENRKYTV